MSNIVPAFACTTLIFCAQQKKMAAARGRQVGPTEHWGPIPTTVWSIQLIRKDSCGGWGGQAQSQQVPWRNRDGRRACACARENQATSLSFVASPPDPTTLDPITVTNGVPTSRSTQTTLAEASQPEGDSEASRAADAEESPTAIRNQSFS